MRGILGRVEVEACLQWIAYLVKWWRVFISFEYSERTVAWDVLRRTFSFSRAAEGL